VDVTTINTPMIELLIIDKGLSEPAMKDSFNHARRNAIYFILIASS